MTFPLNTIPLRKAVTRALTKPTGKYRAIPTEFLFALGVPSLEALNSAQLKNRPSVWVVVRDRGSEAPTNEAAGERRLRCTVRITVHYWAGSENHTAESLKQLDKIDADGARILAALAYPGSLDVDEDGVEVGLDGGSLRAANSSEYSSTGPDPVNTGPDGPRVLRVVHQFLATLTLAQPTV